MKLKTILNKHSGLGGMVNFQEALENLTTRKNTRQGRLYADDMKKAVKVI